MLHSEKKNYSFNFYIKKRICKLFTGIFPARKEYLANVGFTIWKIILLISILKKEYVSYLMGHFLQGKNILPMLDLLFGTLPSL